jgi:hypothetical protein
VDAYAASTGMSAPAETLPVLRDGFDQRLMTELDLAAAGVTNVIWGALAMAVTAGIGVMIGKAV